MRVSSETERVLSTSEDLHPSLQQATKSGPCVMQNLRRGPEKEKNAMRTGRCPRRYNTRLLLYIVLLSLNILDAEQRASWLRHAREATDVPDVRPRSGDTSG